MITLFCPVGMTCSSSRDGIHWKCESFDIVSKDQVMVSVPCCCDVTGPTDDQQPATCNQQPAASNQQPAEAAEATGPGVTGPGARGYKAMPQETWSPGAPVLRTLNQ